MERVVLCCILLLNGGLVYSQLTSTVNNVRLVDHIPYILELMETTVKDIEEYGWCNLKVPSYHVEVEHIEIALMKVKKKLPPALKKPLTEKNPATNSASEDVFDWHVKGNVTFSNAFVTSIQKVDIVQSTVQQVWRYNSTDQTSSVSAQATLRMIDVALGYDVDMELDDGKHHYFTGIFKHNTVQYPFALNYNMFTEEFSASVTMTALPRSTNKMVFAPDSALTQVLSHSYDVTSAAAGMEAWASQVFESLLLNVATHKVKFPQICYNCPA